MKSHIIRPETFSLSNFRLLILSIFLTVASLLTWSFVPRFLKLMIQLSSQVSFNDSISFEWHPNSCQCFFHYVMQTNELYQLAAVAFCLLSAWVSL